jgi:thymidylate synthase (FAD)
MQIIKQHWTFEPGMPTGQEVLERLELAGRTCYKTEGKIETWSDSGTIRSKSAAAFVAGIIKRGHESVLEHVSLSVRIVTDRGVTHELVRHRIASYSQESTRYCNYGKQGEVVFIQPVWTEDRSWLPQESEKDIVGRLLRPEELWAVACRESETHYLALLTAGWSPQQARTVLNNSLKTEIVTTMNIREWRHFFKLRTAKAAHPQMRELAQSIYRTFLTAFPVVFDGSGTLEEAA